MGGLIDLNSTEDDETPLSGSLSPSSSSASVLSAPGSGSSVCLELWHACAGPLISLPKRGNVVVYFPQGHLEQVSDFSGVAAAYDLPPHVFCLVVDVKLHAEGATDEVYAQVSLVPETEKLEGGKTEADGEEEDTETNIKSTTPHMFCKTLTASDTSTHGGFSVPRRAAEDCFPPLDYNQQRPSQELVAKDLHGSEWRFRHIYRGQPRRHLLTSGWSAFVNKKKLVSGDAVLFLRGEGGELRLGIRRAAQIKDGSSFPSSCSQQLNCSNFADVVHAISMKSVFSIYYNPRASSSDFIIPVHKFWKCLDPSFSIGMRFKMQFEAEDAAERRHSGVITGISDINPVQWPGSKWRCLMVRWDDIDANRHSRVSPWEIEPSGSVSGSNSLISPGSKRNRVGFPSGNSEFMVPDGIRASDFGESLWSQVLQVQENLGFNSLYDGSDSPNMHWSEIRRCIPGSIGSDFSAIGNIGRDSLVSPDISRKSVGFGESFRFHKVLQGQEIFVSPPYRNGSTADETQENDAFGLADVGQLSGTRSGWSSLMQRYNTHSRTRPSAPSTQTSSPSSVLTFLQVSNPILNFSPIYNSNNQKREQGVNKQSSFHAPEIYKGKLFPSSSSEHDSRARDLGSTDLFGHSIGSVQLGFAPPLAAQPVFRTSQELDSSCKSSCRLFGFSLTEGRHDASKEEDVVQATSSLAPGAILPCVREEFHPKPSSVTDTVGSNYTEVSNLYAVRDMVLDIAL
ncbi:auxin response factor 3-like isoform X5 [Gossypium arboreum]|uniref:auxin response factor 3-like isoform X5 n=1 Tax=Gossypium arboreum TaxID=29729 RepID=UPI00081909F0|nr:auxin response factor 3-like isoform X5 [Gossypium arboreum]